MQENPMSWLGDFGFDKGEAADATAVNAEIQQKQLELANMIKRALMDSAEGVQLLEYLKDTTIMAPLMQMSRSLPTNAEMGLSPADWAYVRAGQNSVVHFLLDQIAFAMNPPKPESETNG